MDLNQNNNAEKVLDISEAKDKPKYSRQLFLYFSLGIQFLMAILIGLDYAGIQVPVVRQIVGIVYLGFLPGIVILRSLNYKTSSSIRTLLYSIGLSIAFCMIIGALLSFIVPTNEDKPISIPFIFITNSAILMVLTVIAYFRGKKEANSLRVPEFHKESLYRFLKPMTLFLVFIPICSIFGTLIMREYSTNIVMLAVYVMIGLALILAIFPKIFPNNLYPFALFCIAIALLYQDTLISSYMNGWDVRLEYDYAHLTFANARWDAFFYGAYNAMLSISLLPSILANFMQIDIAWVFKIVYPIIFALVPVTLYEAYRSQISARMSFWAALFFILPISFYGAVSSIMRQQIAFFFIALLVMTIFAREKVGPKTKFVFLIFTVALLFSHYATMYFFVLLLAIMWMASVIFRKTEFGEPRKLITGKFLFLCFAIVVGWYYYSAGGSIFQGLVQIGKDTYGNIGGFFSMGTREDSILRAVGAVGTSSFLHSITTNIYRLIYVFIAVGVIQTLFRRRDRKLNPAFIASGLASVGVLVLSILLPNFSQYLHIDRIYQLTLVILSPFFVIGSVSVFKWITMALRSIGRLLGRSVKQTVPRTSVLELEGVALGLLVVLILIPYFLFSSGFVYEIAGDPAPASLTLSQKRYFDSTIQDQIIKARTYYEFVPDVMSAEWLASYSDRSEKVYSDAISQWTVLPAYGDVYPSILLNPSTQASSGSYLYLSNLNVQSQIMALPVTDNSSSISYEFKSLTEYLDFLTARIYTNRESEIYFDQ